MEIRNGRGSPVGSGQETQELRFKFTEFAVAKGAVFSRNLVKRRKGPWRRTCLYIESDDTAGRNNGRDHVLKGD